MEKALKGDEGGDVLCHDCHSCYNIYLSHDPPHTEQGTLNHAFYPVLDSWKYSPKYIHTHTYTHKISRSPLSVLFICGNTIHRTVVSDERDDSWHEQADKTQRQQEFLKDRYNFSTVFSSTPFPFSYLTQLALMCKGFTTMKTKVRIGRGGGGAWGIKVGNEGV